MAANKPGTRGKPVDLNKLKKNLSKEIFEDTVTAADKAYDELAITERIAQIGKLERFIQSTEIENAELKSLVDEEKRNNEEKLARLRDEVNKKCEEVVRSTEQNHRLIKEKEEGLVSYNKQLASISNNFKRTEEKLASEIKLLNDKLTNLELFREERANLIERNNRMQSHLKVVEERTAGIVNVYKRLDLINKDRIGQELKEKLLKLSIEFQESSTTEETKSLIRENIAINNELGGQVGSWQLLSDENRELRKQKTLLLKQAKKEHDETEKYLAANVLQSQVIDRLVHELEKTQGFYDEVNQIEILIRDLEKEKMNTNYVAKDYDETMRLLLQTKHALDTRINELTKECNIVESINHEELVNLRKALLHVADAQFLRLRHARNRLSSEELVAKLDVILELLNNLFPRAQKANEPSVDSFGSYVSLVTYDPSRIIPIETRRSGTITGSQLLSGTSTIESIE